MNSSNTIADNLPATGHDRYEYILKYEWSNIQIQAVVSFAQYLDATVLKRAVRLSLDAEPVLGCRFIEDEKAPYWQRFADIDKMSWFELDQNVSKVEAVEQFLKQPFACEGQSLNVRLIRSEDGDTLCVKICHACSDVAGLKEYLELLALIYSRLQEDPAYKPAPHAEGRRDQKHYFEALGIDEPIALFDPQAHFVPPTWAFPHHGREVQHMQIAMRRIFDEAFGRIVRYGKTHNVTINDIILTAFFRSMFELLEPPIEKDMAVCVTIDLRQAFEGSPDQAICNLSVGMYPQVSRLADESFAGTLKRVSTSMEGLKTAQAALYDAVGLEVWGYTDFSEVRTQLHSLIQWLVQMGKSHPLLSNMGIINPLIFGKLLARDAYLVTPVIYAPGFMLGVSTYNRALTLEVSYCEPAHRREDVEAFMDLMEKELSSL
ncbi:MAG: condensation domain-containing protein [Syntrophomonas sp.]